jgi:hypothetical protein
VLVNRTAVMVVDGVACEYDRVRCLDRLKVLSSNERLGEGSPIS